MSRNQRIVHKFPLGHFLPRIALKLRESSFYTVYNMLGYGFLEKVYRNALSIELCKRGHDVVRQVPVNVFYQDWEVGGTTPICSSIGA